MIYQVKAQMVNYQYVIDPLNSNFDNFIPIVGENVYSKLNIDKIDGVRMVLTPNTISNCGYFVEYLFWITPKNLDELDSKVVAGTYCDDDFEDAIKTYFLDEITCPNCKRKYVGFVVDHGSPYLDNKNLLKQKVDRIYSSKANLDCPNCKKPLRLTVLKLWS